METKKTATKKEVTPPSTATPPQVARTTTEPPVAEKNATPDYQATIYLVARDLVEKEAGWLKKGIENVNFIMGVIVIVLFLGYLSMLLGFFSILVQWWGFNANTQSEMLKANTELKKEVEQLREDIRNKPVEEVTLRNRCQCILV